MKELNQDVRTQMAEKPKGEDSEILASLTAMYNVVAAWNKDKLVVQDIVKVAFARDDLVNQLNKRNDLDFEKVLWDKSSNIKSTSYNKETEDLVIEFKGNSKYEYANVPENVWNYLKKADSIGKYFAKKIKGYYQYKKL